MLENQLLSLIWRLNIDKYARNTPHKVSQNIKYMRNCIHIVFILTNIKSSISTTRIESDIENIWI